MNLDSHLVIFECRSPQNEDNAPLAELSYDYLHVEFLTDHYEFQIKGCGIRIPEDGPTLDSSPCNPDILAQGVCVTLDDSNPFPAPQNEVDESKGNDDEGYMTPLDEEESGYNNDEDEGYETAFEEEECRDNIYDEGYETALGSEEE